MADVQALLDSLEAFSFPGGADSARSMRAVRLEERGEIRSAPNARWLSLTAEQEIDATLSRFRWDARLRGALRFFSVVDAYAEGRGKLVVRAGGLNAKKMTGAGVDQGELQRYLASASLCPPMILNNPALRFTAAGPRALRIDDREALAGSHVDLELDERGCPTTARAERPRAAGNATIPTPWRVVSSDFQEREGLRVPSRAEAWWELADGPFQYYRSEIVSFTVLR